MGSHVRKWDRRDKTQDAADEAPRNCCHTRRDFNVTTVRTRDASALGIDSELRPLCNDLKQRWFSSIASSFYSAFPPRQFPPALHHGQASCLQAHPVKSHR